MLTERFQYHSMEEKKKQGFPPADHSRLEKAGSANKKAAHAADNPAAPCANMRPKPEERSAARVQKEMSRKICAIRRECVIWDIRPHKGVVL